MNTRDAVRASGLDVDGANGARQRSIFTRSCTRRAPIPRVEAARRHTEHLAEDSYGIVGLILADEPEDYSGSVPLSRANRAAAFPRISFSIFSRFTCLRS